MIQFVKDGSCPEFESLIDNHLFLLIKSETKYYFCIDIYL